MIVKESYFRAVGMFKHLHILFMDVIRHELMRLNIRDINSVQCLVIYNIGKENITVGEIKNRRYYMGTNISYNLNKMVKHNYLIQQQDPNDRRCFHVRLSSKGLKLYEKLDELFTRHANTISLTLPDRNVQPNQFDEMLNFLDRFWNKLLVKEASNG